MNTSSSHEDIKNLFNNDFSRKMQGLNNIKLDYIIFSRDKEKAQKKIYEILNNNKENVKHKNNSSNGLIGVKLKNGIEYLWVNPFLENCRGYRCNNCFIDKNLSLEEIWLSNIPYIAMYCGKDTVHVF